MQTLNDLKSPTKLNLEERKDSRIDLPRTSLSRSTMSQLKPSFPDSLGNEIPSKTHETQTTICKTFTT